MTPSDPKPPPLPSAGDPSPALTVFVPAAAGLLFAYAGIHWLQSYGLVVFLGIPLMSSILSGFLHNRKAKQSFLSSYGKAMLSILLIGLGCLLVALDGLLCLIMALPLAAMLALAGVALGQLMANSGRSVATILVLMPALLSAEGIFTPPPALHMVTTSIEIDAPIDKVWQSVVAFPPIHTPPEPPFRLGIAYPVSARIEGTGVGAVRYCEFSTGPFVEPITGWEPPNLLAFDVRESPAPLEELSPYPGLDVPHLHGFLQSRRGQFRLAERNGRTLVEGTTWYSHTVAPGFYWRHISDHLIHRIHYRVLQHIKTTVETRQL